MTDIENEARRLLNEARRTQGLDPYYDYKEGDARDDFTEMKAMCRLLEEFDAFKKEVSDAILRYHASSHVPHGLQGFILKPVDPLVEVFDECFHQEVREGETWSEAMSRKVSTALAARGYEITKTKEQNY
jgi:hypothetical protein